MVLRVIDGCCGVVVAALAKSQVQGSLFDTDFLVKLLHNPEKILKLMNEHGMVTKPKTGYHLALNL